MKLFYAFYIIVFSFQHTFGQQPKYTLKAFVKAIDSSEFKNIQPPKNGFSRRYILAKPVVYDVDDDNTTSIMGSIDAMLCFEGQLKNGKKEGVYTVYLIDSFNHSKRYKIWEQTLSSDKLNGQWRVFSLNGTLISFQTFKNDSLNGITRSYWIDGKEITNETEYFNGVSKNVKKDFFNNGNVKSAIPYENGKITGTGKKYYEDGTLKEVAEFKDGEFNGSRKYYYPNGQIWIEELYKEGKHWEVVSNYTSKGEKREAGTLRSGKGTIILYNEDGSVRETRMFVDGEGKE